MDRTFQKKYKEKLQEIKTENIEALFTILNYAISNTLQVYTSYEKNKKVVSEFYKFVKEQTIVLDYLKRNLDNIDSQQFYQVIDILGAANGKAKLYCYGYLGNKENESEFIRLKQLIDINEYQKRIFCAMLSFEHIKEYLNCLSVTDTFWEYIVEHTVLTEDDVYYGVRVKMNENIVNGVTLYVPPVKNLETALINIREIKRAYDMYKLIGFPYKEGICDLKVANNQIGFQNVYVQNKVKQYFRRFDNIQQKN